MPKRTDYKTLLIRYLDDQASPEDERRLFEELLQGDEANWQKMLEAILVDQTPEPDYKEQQWAVLLDKVLQQGENGALQKEMLPVHIIHLLKTTWLRYAAMLLLFVGAALALYQLNRPQQTLIAKQTTSSPHIQPGGNKAMLTLSDGSTIILDSAANGAIAQQGNTQIVKEDNGYINYKLHGEGDGTVLINTMRTPRGGQYQLTLPDGTKVLLNAASALRYPTQFSGKERRVELSGEAYFEVAQKANQPFFVTINARAEVQVLGTSFNVNAYENESNLATTLIDGSVKVSLLENASSHGKDAVLRPGQQAQIEVMQKAGQEIAVVNNVNINKVLAWKNGLFNFNGLPLPTVMRQLERWYDIEVVYEKEIPAITFLGEMTKDISLNDLLIVLDKLNVHYRLEGRKLIIRP